VSVNTQSSDTSRLPIPERTGVGVPAIEHALVIALIPAHNEEEQIAEAIRWRIDPRPALHAAAGLTAAQWRFTPPGR
jgi:hypothetical protein